MRRCPACSELLFKKRVEQVEVDGCPGCGGLWLDPGELQQLARDSKALRAAGASFPPGLQASVGATRTNQCPKCQAELTPFEFDRFRGVRLDRCKGCGGMWLDHGEAQEIASRLEGNAPAAAAAAPAAPQPLQPQPQLQVPVRPAAPPPRFGPPPAEEDELELAYDPYAGRGNPAEAPAEGDPGPELAASLGAPGYGVPPPNVDPAALQAFEPVRREIPLGTLIPAVIVLALFVYWIWPTKLADVELKPAASAASSSDPCIGKDRCVVVVVAPWCPACKVAVPIINEMAKRFADSPKVGIKPVVAYDQEANLEKMAKSLTGPVFLDPSGALLRKMGDKGVPYWYVVTSSNRVVEDFAGVVPQVDLHLEKLGLADL